MKMLNVYYGIDAYSFTSGIQHVDARVDVSEDDIAYFISRAQKALINKSCFWYFVDVVTIDPYTGVNTHVHYHGCVKEKEKIVLNAEARKMPHKPKKPSPIVGQWENLPIAPAPAPWPNGGTVLTGFAGHNITIDELNEVLFKAPA